MGHINLHNQNAVNDIYDDNINTRKSKDSEILIDNCYKDHIR